MARQLRVLKNSDGEPAVRCPRCDEMIQPEPNPLGLDGSDCVECNQQISDAELRGYARARRLYDQGEWE